MGGKYEIIGKKYGSPCEDIHIFTNKLIEALKAYRKAKKMFFCAFIVRNDKYIKRGIEDKEDER